jgi:hypothetical protein
VTVPLKEKDPDINRKVRELLPRTLVVKVEEPESERRHSERLGDGATPAEHYSAFHRREHHDAPHSDVIETFEDLYSAASGEEV